VVESLKSGESRHSVEDGNPSSKKKSFSKKKKSLGLKPLDSEVGQFLS